MAAANLTAARLRELVVYDPETGVFMRRMNGRRTAGTLKAMGTWSQGYLQASVDGRRYQLHRLAWLYVTGAMPSLHIDHRNVDRSGNRFCNLREAVEGLNAQNQARPHSNNKSGFLGVHQKAGSRKWAAGLTANAKTIYLGSFETPEMAHQAYLEAKRRLHPGCTI